MCKKKYKWESRYSFNSKEILRDFKNLDEFREKFEVTKITYLRGFKNIGKYSHIPQKYIIDKKTSAKVLLCEGVILAKNEKEATHFFEFKENGKLALRSKKCKS